MLLITFNVWHGPSTEAMRAPKDLRTPVKESTESHVTRLPLGQALRRIRIYEEAFNCKYRAVSAVNFSLLQVAEIDDLDEVEIEIARVNLIETLERQVTLWKASSE